MIARMLSARIMLAQHLSFAAEREIGRRFDHVHLLASGIRGQPDPRTVTIAIPGAFGFGKKDAESLFALVCDARLDPRVRFVLLGRFSGEADATAWWQRCIAHGVDHRMTRFTDFVAQDEFNRQLQQSSAVLPLIHPGCDHYTRFRSEKISGAVNLALGAHLPLVIHADLARQWCFGPVVSTYGSQDELVRVINALAVHPTLQAQRERIAASKEAHPAFQQALYLQACARAVRTSRGETRPVVVGKRPAWKPRMPVDTPVIASSPPLAPPLLAGVNRPVLLKGR
jgi:hypothetical protein